MVRNETAHCAVVKVQRSITLPCFVNTVSVEDILSYEVRHKYHSGKGKAVTSSGRVLQELGKTFPEAASLFNRCFEGGSGAEQEDYAKLQIGSATERKILWIRVALVDGKLQGVVEQLIKKRRYDVHVYTFDIPHLVS